LYYMYFDKNIYIINNERTSPFFVLKRVYHYAYLYLLFVCNSCMLCCVKNDKCGM